MNKTLVRYIHRISPRDYDRAGPFEITAADLATVDSARAWLKNTTGDYPRKQRARRTESGGWVFFPPDRCGNWHSISIVLLGPNDCPK